MKRIATFALALFVLAAPGWAGTYYEATTTVATGQRGGDSRMVVHGWVEGDRARVEFRDSNNPMVGKGNYLITTDGGKTLFMVDPKEKTYMAWDLGAMAGALGSMMQAAGGMVNIEFRDHKLERLSQEAGPRMLGHPTTHYRFRTAYTTEVKVFRMGQETRTETLQEVWATTALTDAGFGAWLRNEPPRTGIAGLDEMLRNEMGTTEGFPLKMVSTSTNTDKKGKQSTSTTTMEVTVLREEPVPASMFAIPEGYERTEIPTFPAMGGTR
jgi:hypothetical protein